MKERLLHNLWFLNAGILFFTILLVAKLGYIQIALGEYYRDKAESPYMLASGSFDRGSIFFEKKTGLKISAATIVPDYTLAIDPTKVVNASLLADQLLAVVSFDRADFIVRAQRKGDKYEEVVRHISEEDASRLRTIDDKSIILKKEKKRFYPGGQTASQVLGFVSLGSDDVMAGRYGLERYYEETLSRSGDASESSFFADLFLKPGANILFDRDRKGDIVTTIEPTVQGFVERTLVDDVLKKYSAEKAMAIVMDPKTGAVYAMGGVPSFDPNAFSKEKKQSVFANPLVSDSYEMGSIIKPLTVASGIDAGVITGSTTYDDKGFRVFNTKRISNFDGKGRGITTIQEALNQSLNTGTMFVMERLGKERFRDYFKLFALDQETGIDLPGEVAGDLRNLESPRDVEFATASFGQGISTTPIAMVRAVSALANGGVLVDPHVVKRIEYGFGSSKDFVQGGARRVIKKETSEEISRMMTAVADEGLFQGKSPLPHYSIAVKTGTAQQVEGGHYSDTNYLHTFIGYFPSYDPQFIIFLAVKNPRGEQYASHTLKEPFMQIVKFLINYYEVPPDR